MLEPAGSTGELMDRIRKHTEECYMTLLKQGHSEQAARQMIGEEVGEIALMLRSFISSLEQERMKEMGEVQRALKTRFMGETESTANLRVLVTAVMLPTGAIETITNSHRLEDKVKYLRDAYNDEFRLKVNPEVRIVGYMLV